MNTAVKAKNSSRQSDRIIFCKTAFAIFDGEPQAIVKTTDISVSGVGLSSPVQGLPKTTCWVRLKIPESHHSNKLFDVKTTVIFSVYSKDNHAFRTGLQFQNPPPLLVDMIEQIISNKA